MNTLKIFFAAVLGAGLFASTASASIEVYNLPIHAQYYAGSTGIVKLRQRLQNRYGLQLNKYKLIKVKVDAKSKFKQGRARLMVNHNEQSRQRVTGGIYQGQAPASYHRFFLQNYTPNAGSPWQVHFNGNIKVKRIKVFLKRRPQALVFSPICIRKAELLSAKSKSCHTNTPKVRKIRLVGVKKTVKVKRVTVVFGNGSSMAIPLTGKLFSGQKKTYTLPSQRRVVNVIVKAKSGKIFGSRSRYQVQLGHR